MKEAAAQPDDLGRGIDLFNHGEFFEAHEVLEDVWRGCPAGTARRRHLQGLVQLAVAFHHESRGNVAGARSVLERGVKNLAGVEESLPELDLERLHIALAHWQSHLTGAGSRPGLPRITWRVRTGRRSAAKTPAKKRSPAKIRKK